MPTTRRPATNYELVRKKFEDYLGIKAGTFTLTSFTRTVDNDGRITAVSSSTSTISGDMQYVTYKDVQRLGEGVARVGDGMFFCKHDVSINPEDEITSDSKQWVLSKQIELPEIEGQDIYQGWIATRKNA